MCSPYWAGWVSRVRSAGVWGGQSKQEVACSLEVFVSSTKEKTRGREGEGRRGQKIRKYGGWNEFEALIELRQSFHCCNECEYAVLKAAVKAESAKAACRGLTVGEMRHAVGNSRAPNRSEAIRGAPFRIQ